MKRTWRVLCLPMIVGLVSSLQAADSGEKFYWKVDVGAAARQDIRITQEGPNSFPASFTLNSDLAPANIPSGLSNYLGAMHLDVNQLTNGAGLVPAGPYNAHKLPVETNPGFSIGAAGGYNFDDCWSAEIQLGLTFNSIFTVGYQMAGPLGTASYTRYVDGNFYQIPILANLIYKLPTGSKFRPYIGAGGGGVFTILDADKTGTDFAFAYQGMAGIVYEYDKKLDFGFGGKLLGTTDHDFGHYKTDGFITLSIMAQLTYRF